MTSILRKTAVVSAALFSVSVLMTGGWPPVEAQEAKPVTQPAADAAPADAVAANRRDSVDRIEGNYDVGIIGGYRDDFGGGDNLGFGNVWDWFFGKRATPGTDPAAEPPYTPPSPGPGTLPPPAKVDNGKALYLQPQPIYYRSMKSRGFSLPFADHWESDTSASFCEDSDLPSSLAHHCNNYVSENGFPLKSGTATAGITSKFIAPHQMIFDPFMYWPVSTISANINLGHPADLVNVGFNFTLDGHNYVYSNYGYESPVAVPGIDQDDLSSNQVYLGEGAADKQQDGGEDNVLPNLFGQLDPVNLAFEIEPFDLIGNDKVPVSVTTGWFSAYTPADKVKTLKRYGVLLMASLMQDLPLDLAILKRDSVGNGRGYVSFIPHQGFEGDSDCVYNALQACNGGICNTDPANSSCADCFTPVAPATSTPTIDAINVCPKTTSYKGVPIVDDIALEGTDNPVFILSAPTSARLRNFSSINTIAGNKYMNSLRGTRSTGFVVLNRGGVDCFRDIRFRNTELKDGPGEDMSLEDASGNGLVGIEDTRGIPVFKDNGSPLATVMPAAAGSNKCGYLTFYDVDDDNGNGKIEAGEVKVKHFPESSSDPADIVKVPVGYNPVAMALGDPAATGSPGLIVTNEGDRKAGVSGSVVSLWCLGDYPTNSLTTNPIYASGRVPVVPPPIYDLDGDNAYWTDANGNGKLDEGEEDLGETFPICQSGLFVQDFPIDGTFKSKHPWWLTVNTFKGHSKKADIDLNGDGTKDHVELAFLGVRPSDAAVTFIDSFENGKGDFGVLLNDIDTDTTQKWYNRVRFTAKSYPTDGLLTPVGPAGPLAWPLITDPGRGLYPLGVTDGYFSNNQYVSGILGLDVLIKNVMSNLMPGWLFMNKVAPKTGLFGQFCDELMIGFNNSHQMGRWKNTIAKDVTFTTDMATTDASGNVTVTTETSTVDRCTGEFTAPTERADVPQATTPVYNGATNWGPKYLKSTFASTQTKAAMRNGEPIVLYNVNYEDSTKTPHMVIDAQFDFTHDASVINGEPLRFPATPSGLAGSGGGSEALPNDACSESHFELGVVQTDTKQIAKPYNLSSKLTIDTVYDPGIPQFCYQRYYKSLEQVCCLLVEDPNSPAFVGYDNLPKYMTCPGKDPMECCMVQNADNVPAPIPGWDAEPPVPGIFHPAGYDKNAADCKCAEEYKAFIDAGAKSPFDYTAWKAAYIDYWCECIGHDAPGGDICEPPTTEPCKDIADPTLKACCEAGKTVAECVGPCYGISDPDLKACCDAGKTLAECTPGPKCPAADYCCNTYDANLSGGLDGAEIITAAADPKCGGTTTGSPGTGSPGTGSPGTGSPGTGSPGTGGPGTGSPGTGGPGGTGPSTSACSESAWGDKLHCCTDHDGNGSGSIDTWGEWMDVFNDDSCVDPDDSSGDCNIVVNIGGDVNGQLNICCNVINNSGTISGSTIMQACSNADPCTAASSASGDVPASCKPFCVAHPEAEGCQDTTTPEGGPKAAVEPDSCVCDAANPGDIYNGKVIGIGAGGGKVPFLCRAALEDPTGVVAFKVIQTAGTIVNLEGADVEGAGTKLTGPKELVTKTLTPGATEFSQVVYAPPISSMFGYSDQSFELSMVALNAAGSEVKTLACKNVAFVEAKGGSGCGCDMASERPSYPLANVLLALTGLLPLGVMLGLRKRAVKRQ